MTSSDGDRRPRPQHLHLLPAGAEPSFQGQTLPPSHGFTGRLAVTASETHVALGLPELSHAELRWGVDRMLRRVRALIGRAPVVLHLGEGLEGAATTLALDLHHATRGELEIPDQPDLQAEVARVGALEDLYRAWVMEDPAERTSLAIARDISDWATRQPHCTVEVLAEPELSALGLRLILAVGQGSEASPSRLVIARYDPPEARGGRWMLLGKGITFDSGGINVKPYLSHVSQMKNDMGGAALAYALFKGLVEAGHPRPLTLAIPTCENSIDGRSMRPGAIVESYRGHTVRIDHTDAEGRLVLADALAYVGDVDEPEQIVSFATLTTAALIAYGPYATPVHFARPEHQARLEAAATHTGEDLHFFPARIWHAQANRDGEAFLKNTGRLPGKAASAAGSRNAAHFLRYFTERPLLHFDIFASTWNWAGDAPGSGVGATGAPLRTLLEAFAEPR